MVFPVPNPPATAATPPRAIGKKVSTTRCPVTSGRFIASRPTAGRGLLAGQRCSIVNSRFPASVSTIAITSRTEYSPAAESRVSRPLQSGGTRIGC